ncbi:MAG TPA: hypothetical protein ENG81_03165 [Candidatus Bathyarchaeota archaeon]|nr:hypothetical protein [Candidatus Bathyarchaeota archaeon]
MSTWYERLENIDPRWIYLLVYIVIAIPIIVPLPSPLAITPYTRDAFEAVEKLPPGSLVVLSFDYSGANPELHPQAIAIFRHVVRRPLYIYIVGMWSDGPVMADQIWKVIDKTGYDPENPTKLITKEYGKHIVNLGYLATTALIVGVYDTITKMMTIDLYGNPIDSLPLVKKFDGIKYASLVISFAAGSPGPATYLQYWATQNPNMKFVVGSPGVSAPGFMPYYEAGKLGEIGYVGVIISMRGAAEYETLLGEIGLTGAVAALNAQSAVHYLLVVAVILGNLGYYLRKYGGGGR